jgi:NAD(P)-dependent dehydrogenase (short-subunit alcohol dehydrogenase family)
MLTHHLRHTFRPGTRIVQVASSVHDRAEGIDFDRLQRRSSFMGLNEYAVSKLANVLFVREMARRQPDWRLYAVHPGLVSTNLIPGVVRFFYRNRILTPEQGADTPLWCATSDDVADESGNYYAKRETRTPSPVALDDELADELWRRSELWCGVTPQQ